MQRDEVPRPPGNRKGPDPPGQGSPSPAARAPSSARGNRGRCPPPWVRAVTPGGRGGGRGEPNCSTKEGKAPGRGKECGFESKQVWLLILLPPSRDPRQVTQPLHPLALRQETQLRAQAGPGGARGQERGRVEARAGCEPGPLVCMLNLTQETERPSRSATWSGRLDPRVWAARLLTGPRPVIAQGRLGLAPRSASQELGEGSSSTPAASRTHALPSPSPGLAEPRTQGGVAGYRSPERSARRVGGCRLGRPPPRLP